MSNLKSKYSIMHHPYDKSKWWIKLEEASGDWSGIMYSYGKFNIKEPTTPEGNALFSFERDILHVPEELRGKEFADDRENELTTLMGQILYDILQDNLDKIKQIDNKLVLELSEND